MSHLCHFVEAWPGDEVRDFTFLHCQPACIGQWALTSGLCSVLSVCLLCVGICLEACYQRPPWGSYLPVNAQTFFRIQVPCDHLLLLALDIEPHSQSSTYSTFTLCLVFSNRMQSPGCFSLSLFFSVFLFFTTLTYEYSNYKPCLTINHSWKTSLCGLNPAPVFLEKVKSSLKAFFFLRCVLMFSIFHTGLSFTM